MKLSAKAKVSMQKMISRFEAGDLSPVTQVITLKLPEDAPARNWSFANRVMAQAQTGAVDCRGYRQWQAKDRQVKKGSQAGFIFVPRITTKEKGTKDERQQVIGFLTTAVFSIEDTEGDSPVAEYQPKELPPLMDVAKRLGVDVDWMPLEGKLGYCRADNSKIRLATHEEAVFFHELAHAAHNTYERKASGGQDKHRETVAELTAAVLMQLFGLKDHAGNAWKYIQSYNPSDPLKAILKAMADVERVLGVMFDEPVTV